MPAPTPGTDEWWFARLAAALSADELRFAEIDLWAKGMPPLPADLPDLVKPHYRRLLEIARVHLANLPVTALSRRLILASFRTAAAGDDEGDRTAEAMWSRMTFADLKLWAIRYGRAYSRTEVVGGEVRITAESPRQTITEQDPSRPGESLAALKVYRDAENDRDVAVLDRPGYVRVAYRQGVAGRLPGQGRRWSWNPEQWSIGEKTDTGMTRCAVTLFDLEEGVGRFEAHLPTLRRINHTIVQRMVIIALQAFRQRALKGAPKDDPETGEPIDYDDVFTSDPGAMWVLPAAVELWESGQADLTPVLTAVKDDVRFFAIGTGTPVHIFQPDAANGSAEGAALLREGLVFDALDTIDRWRIPAARTLSLAFEAAKDTARADQARIESIWANPARESLTARASAAVQLKAAGVPWRARMELALQATPAEIRRWAQDRTADAFLEDDGTDELPETPATPPPPAPPAPPVGGDAP